MSDKARLNVALILCGILLFGYMIYSANRAQKDQPPQPQKETETETPGDGTNGAKETTPPENGKTLPPDDVPDVGPGSADEPDEFVETITKVTNNENIIVEFTDRGGAIARLTLKKHFRQLPEDDQLPELLVLLAEFKRGLLSLDINATVRYPGGNGTEPKEVSLGPLSRYKFEMRNRTERTDGVVEIEYYRSFLDGDLEVVRTYTVFPENHFFDLTVGFLNKSGTPIEVQYAIHSARGIVRDTAETAYPKMYLKSVLGYPSFHFDKFPISKITKIEDERTEEGISPKLRITDPENIHFAGGTNKYYAAILIQRKAPLARSAVESFKVEAEDLPDVDMTAIEPVTRRATSFLETQRFSLGANESAVHEYVFFAGPKKFGGELGMKNIIEYGWAIFAWISRLLVPLLSFFYLIVRNYGVAIILLTIVVKAVLSPLSSKQFHSMKKMQSLKPKLDALKEKCKKNKKILQEKTMALYREEGVNPLGSCLPLLLQMPIFFGLYNALRYTIELRHAPFFWWIKDLSSPDAVMTFSKPFSFFFVYIPTLNILPAFTALGMFVSMKLAPQPPDKQQRQQMAMMQVMPFIMMVLFWNIPSGLTLYIFVSICWSIAEQAYFRKRFGAAYAALESTSNPAKKGGK